jgi:hypothetical protein
MNDETLEDGALPPEIGAFHLVLHADLEDGDVHGQSWSSSPRRGHYLVLGPFQTTEMADAYRDAVLTAVAADSDSRESSG